MTKQEVIDKLTQRGLLKVKNKYGTISFINGEELYYDNVFHEKKFVYGVFYNVRRAKYEFFVTGGERGGMIDYYSCHETEDEAYTILYDYIERFKD